MNNSKRFLLGTTFVASIAFLAPQLAMAAAATPAAADTTEVGELVVTGSHIKKSEFTSPSPVQVINSEVSTLEGLVDSTKILQQSSLASGSFQVNNQLTGFVTTGGPGANTVGLRGLGATRTLILLNGHRVGPAGTRGTVGPVDLNVIPSSIVDRFEILKDGASSIYGSDAVAGVINIITKSHLDGGEIDLYGDRAFKAGADEYSATAAWGKVFDRGYVNGSFNYYEQRVLRRGDRADTSCTSDYEFDATTHLPVDYTNTDPGQPPQAAGNLKCYGLFTRVLRTGAFGDLIYPDAGVVYPGTAAGNSGGTNNAAGAFGSMPVPFGFVRQARAGFPGTFPYAHEDAAPDERASVVSPVKRTSLFFTGGYDLAAHTQLYGELLFNRRDSIQYGARQFFPSVATTLSTVPAAFEAPNVVGQPQTNLGSLLPIIPLNSDRSQRVDYWHGNIGLKGDFGGALHKWSYDLVAQYSSSDATYTTDIIYNDRVRAITGVNPVTGALNGTLACDQALITISGGQCSNLPGGIDWTSSRILNGNFNAAEQAFLFTKESGHTAYTQRSLEGTISGSVLDLPAGPLSTAFGFAMRHDFIDDNPGLNERSGNLWGSTSAGRTTGGDTVNELFVETHVPIMKDTVIGDNLDFDGSYRYTHYRSYGNGGTYKLGLNWQVIPDLRLRATRGTSFRAPALYELYLANQTSFLGQTSIDPCINYATSGSPVLQANCLAAGIPGDYSAAGTSSATIITGGGAGILKAETSVATTLGVVLTPRWFNLSIAVDYFNIHVRNEIRQFGASNIANQCYNSPQFATEPFCTLITRDPTTHQILTLNNSYVNVAEEKNRGLDLTMRYSKTFEGVKFTIDTQATWQTKDVTTLLAGAATNDYNGTTFGFKGPDFTANMQARADWHDWTLFYSLQFIGKGSDTELFGTDVFNSTRYSGNCRVGAGPIQPCNSLLGSGVLTVQGRPVYFKQYVEPVTYHEISVRKKFDKFTVQAGIQNLTDERPPAQSSGQFRIGTAALNAYDMVGRRAFVDVKFNW
jgi:iron complex outermembrane receptor protein